jgi:hypothetical protein
VLTEWCFGVYLVEDTPKPMKLLTKVPMMVIMLILSSCFSLRTLNKGDEPITEDFLSNIESGMRYEFTLKTGQTQTVYITGTNDQTITGYLEKRIKGKMTRSNYSSSFKSIEENVTKIYVRKFNPYLTTVAIAVPVTLTIILVVTALDNITLGL